MKVILECRRGKTNCEEMANFLERFGEKVPVEYKVWLYKEKSSPISRSNPSQP